MMLKKLFTVLRNNSWLIFIIFIGSLSWSVVMVRSGNEGFWGPNGHDGVWHVALANSLKRGSFEMPVFSGENLKNYHIGFDLSLAFLSFVINISVNRLYFQIIPPILAVAIGVLVYKLAGKWAVFFTYFGGSFGWVLGKGESTFWSQQAISTLINPPFALSLIIILSGLVYLGNPRKQFSIYNLLTTIFIFSILIQVKAYAGVLVLGGLFVIAIWQIFKQRKFDYFKIFLGTLIFSLVLFLPFNSGSGGLLVFKPFWFLETMMGLSDRVGWLKFGEAMVNYKYAHNLVKGIPAYLVALFIFWYGNMGTRILGEVYLAIKLRRFKEIGVVEVFILAIILGGVIIPLLFLQKGTPWNTIQFFYYSLFFMGIMAGKQMLKLNKYLQIIIVLLTIPTTLITLKTIYLTKNPPAFLPVEEWQALQFLNSQPSGVVLTYPFDEIKSAKANENPPRPLYLYVSTAYVSAYSDKPVYLEDEMNLDITGFDFRERRKKVEEFLLSNDSEFTKRFLEESKIEYIYWLKNKNLEINQRAVLGETQLGIEKIYENEMVDIYKVL